MSGEPFPTLELDLPENTLGTELLLGLKGSSDEHLVSDRDGSIKFVLLQANTGVHKLVDGQPIPQKGPVTNWRCMAPENIDYNGLPDTRYIGLIDSMDDSHRISFVSENGSENMIIDPKSVYGKVFLSKFRDVPGFFGYYGDEEGRRTYAKPHNHEEELEFLSGTGKNILLQIEAIKGEKSRE